MHPKNERNATPQLIMSVRDLSPDRGAAKDRFKTPCGDISATTLENRKRQVVDTLLRGPVYCASTVRIGDAVFRLKEDHNLHAVTKTTNEGRKYYALECDVERIGGAA